ncbi:hypothetical protein [Microbacterium sp. zg-YB36]|uniref:hypothetical protein n=1 Tax=Microbacterium sp. zg-YB36 TaxID=2969407 RepID=UPI00214B2167|nr:hypothetical protein [Microbacterium sp. zg-YB36]MDL5350932.1 hypothetical protein [Microbacterium sp. zg-YB36]
MLRVHRLAVISATALIAIALTACGEVDRHNGVSERPEATCDDLAASVLDRARTDDTSGAINSEIDRLGGSCPDEYDIVIDYLSSRSMPSEFRFDACEEWAQRIHPEAVDLLRADGICTDGATAGQASSSGPEGGLSWDQALEHVGSYQRVCGPLASSGRDYDDVFLNLGRAYPDPARFTIVLWDVGGIEALATGTTLCASGSITLYDGVAQLELDDVGAVEVWG